MSSVVVGSRRWWALALIALAQFVVIMDTSIIGVALPQMRAELGFSQQSLSWVFNAYVVAFGGLLLLGGRLADLFGAPGSILVSSRIQLSPVRPWGWRAGDLVWSPGAYRLQAPPSCAASLAVVTWW